ncbi:hypothetical protein GOP47_0007339 [Adiantum capillus-veneris]|uniref:J domain-containing protein n=1 Tax=Adiantum capillus-veneris TaxID=13818 RepID=A0A9D4ZLT8_ADICA|nr:hypothetical protein GOP47_0007339 [Adiantum capillus-veneris]
MITSASSRRALRYGWQEWRRSFSQPVEALFRQLGLSQGATLDEVKQAYRRRALECHPDLHHNDGTEFRRLTESYNQLINRGGSYHRRIHVRSAPTEHRIFQGPRAFWWVSLFLTVVLFWYPSHMYLQNRNRVSLHEPSRYIEPSRDAAKRERIAAIILEKQRKAKDQQ